MDADRFWAKVDRGDPDSCWLWTAGCSGDGYGAFSVGGKNHGAHRVAFFIQNGRWPIECRHSCDVPTCCNPNHLSDGTRLSNAEDMRLRGRSLTGIRNPKARLCEDDVRQIRMEYASGGVRLEDLALRFGVQHAAVWKIVKRKTWSHV